MGRPRPPSRWENSVYGKGEQCSLCRGRPRPRRRTCYTRAPSGSIGMRPLGTRAGGPRARRPSGFQYSAFQFHRRFVAVSPSLFLSSHTFSSPTHSLPRSLIPSSCRIRRARPTEITTREIACEMVKQIHNLVLTRSHAKEAFGFRIIGGKEQGLTFKVRRLHMMLIFL